MDVRGPDIEGRA